MNKSLIVSATLVAAVLSAGLAVAKDEGMWLFDKPPTAQLKERYGFEPTAKWLENLQLSCVRFSTGGSGSIVSGDGLVMTNHHVAADMLAKLSTKDKDLLLLGFYASTRDQEAKCPDLELDCLNSIEDVTDRVNGAAKPEMSSAEAALARRKMMSAIEKEANAKTGLKEECVTLYQGGKYSLYSYKRYTDVRLVFAPEKQAAFFGGDPDNFEFPRFDLDCSFFRIYENGKALTPSHWLKWSPTGTKENDLVFVAGHPGRTERLFTVDHLKFLRDVRMPFTLASLARNEIGLRIFSDRNEEWRRIAEDDLFSVQNSRKALMGIQAGLQDPQFMKAKLDGERELRAKVDANPEWKKKWGDAWDQLATAEAKYRPNYARFSLLGGPSLALGGKLPSVAKDLVRLADELPKPNSDRLREYGDAGLETLQFQLFSPAPIYPDLEIAKLTMRLAMMGDVLGNDDPLVVAALAGKSPHARAEELIHGSKLVDVAERKRLFDGGKSAIDASKDPLIAFVKSLDLESRRLRKQYEDEVQSAEREGYAKIAAAQFAVFGDKVYPDATFTLRLSYGKVAGYDENGAHVSPYTTIGGLYDRSKQRANQWPFNVPESWMRSKSKLDLSTPFDFVSTCDIIGGNSGSPTVDRKGDVVGLIFDGNIQSLSWDIAFDDVQGRAVSVDSRALIEALNKVYDAKPLVGELIGSARPGN